MKSLVTDLNEKMNLKYQNGLGILSLTKTKSKTIKKNEFSIEMK